MRIDISNKLANYHSAQFFAICNCIYIYIYHKHLCERYISQVDAQIYCVANCRSREHFVKMLSEFVSDNGKTVLEFPSTLNSHERYLIHEVCQLPSYLFIDFILWISCSWLFVLMWLGC